MEQANRLAESDQFFRYDRVRIVNSSALFDHTNGTANGSSIRLSGGENEKTGLVKTLSVMPGDVVNMEVYAKYLDKNQTNWTTQLAQIVNPIISGTSGVVTDGGQYATNQSNPFPYTGMNSTSSSSGTGPKAYLNYIFFDCDYIATLPSDDPSQTFYVQVPASAKEAGANLDTNPNGTPHALLSASVTVKKAGYMYIYLSNEDPTPAEVYFDDFKVTQVKSPVVQMDDYYPYGLTFNSYSRENSVEQKYTYNGKEEQDELGLGWLDFGRRMYQPDIGRFMVHDRFTEKFFMLSSYQFAANNPLSFIDINGDSIIAITRQNINIENSPAEEGGENFTNTITLESDVSMDDVSDYSAGIVNDAMVTIGDNSVTVSSGTRTPEQQASAMYNNLENGSVAGEKKTYGAGGDQVIDTYVQAKAETKEVTNACGEVSCVPQYTPGQIKQKMVDKINAVGPSNVSNHTVGDRSKLNVFDIKPSTVSDVTKFHNTLSGDTRVKQVLSKVNKPAEKAVHIEILQKK
jgi:RHS repeat-associated protein